MLKIYWLTVLELLDRIIKYTKLVELFLFLENSQWRENWMIEETKQFSFNESLKRQDYSYEKYQIRCDLCFFLLRTY